MAILLKCRLLLISWVNSIGSSLVYFCHWSFVEGQVQTMIWTHDRYASEIIVLVKYLLELNTTPLSCNITSGTNYWIVQLVYNATLCIASVKMSSHQLLTSWWMPPFISHLKGVFLWKEQITQGLWKYKAEGERWSFLYTIEITWKWLLVNNLLDTHKI